MVTSTERLVETNGVQLRVIEAGERGAPLVVLAHGFPELAYSWRHQIPVLAQAGYHVLAPDQRGYGGSSRPEAIEDYDIVALCNDIASLLDSAGAERAAIVGHDWGAILAWNFPLLYPDRVIGTVGMSVPPVPRPGAPPTKIWRELFGENFFYILYFQDRGVAETDLGRDTRETMLRVFGGPRRPDDTDALARMLAPGPMGWVERLPAPIGLAEWISTDEFDHYVAEFSRTGFAGGLNWYRNFDRNWELTATTPAATITVPSMFITGSADPVRHFTRSDRAREVVAGEYRELVLDGAGHWIQQERPEEVNDALVNFLSGLEM
ncbi:MAG: alpha/beta hydrolase [Mycobacteriaceae bacterium]|nr:alpha/beta hydrolase [Mycobacteriaceae bacterium]